MNDIELDEMLDQWKAPSVEMRLRRPKRGLPRWIPLSLAAAAVLFIVVRAFPQTAPGSIPYIVESEYFRYGDEGGGPPSLSMRTYSYNMQGGEQLISRWVPGDSPIQKVGRQILDVPMDIFRAAIIPRLAGPGGQPAVMIRPMGSSGVIANCSEIGCLSPQTWGIGRGAALIANGCVWAGSTVLGTETILGHATVASSFTPQPYRSFTTWMAPDLGCFALKVREEWRNHDEFRLFGTKQAIRIFH